MKKLNICKNCGEDKQYHCNFEAIEIPDSCICDPDDWGNINKIPKICNAKLVSLNQDNFCNVCEHQEECHNARS